MLCDDDEPRQHGASGPRPRAREQGHRSAVRGARWTSWHVDLSGRLAAVRQHICQDAAFPPREIRAGSLLSLPKPRRVAPQGARAGFSPEASRLPEELHTPRARDSPLPSARSALPSTFLRAPEPIRGLLAHSRADLQVCAMFTQPCSALKSARYSPHACTSPESSSPHGSHDGGESRGILRG